MQCVDEDEKPAPPRLCALQVRATDVHLPAGSCFVVANSLTVSNKQETADKRWVKRGSNTWQHGGDGGQAVGQTWVRHLSKTAVMTGKQWISHTSNACQTSR